ncbi:hypothetical protein HK405_014093 [Cladochytrium tenue]|nr:hypothetical protein HK405_014093 [Cladochytrium tenue]
MSPTSSSSHFVVSRGSEFDEASALRRAFKPVVQRRQSSFRELHSSAPHYGGLGRSNSLNNPVGPHPHAPSRLDGRALRSGRLDSSVVFEDNDDDESIEEDDDASSIWVRQGVNPLMAVPGSCADVSSIASGVSNRTRDASVPGNLDRTPTQAAAATYPSPEISPAMLTSTVAPGVAAVTREGAGRAFEGPPRTNSTQSAMSTLSGASASSSFFFTSGGSGGEKLSSRAASHIGLRSAGGEAAERRVMDAAAAIAALAAASGMTVEDVDEEDGSDAASSVAVAARPGVDSSDWFAAGSTVPTMSTSVTAFSEDSSSLGRDTAASADPSKTPMPK